MKDNKIIFVGAGPGDPDLLTIKGKKLIDSADVIVYTGSLVNPEIFRDVKPEAELIDSSSMTLSEIIKILEESFRKGLKVLRVHTGDPTLYSSIGEQIKILTERGIDVEVIPGISSYTAAACSLKRELTVPGTTQTVILTRVPGRTKLPESENLTELAKSRATLIFFLSAKQSKTIQETLLDFYPGNTPVAIVYKVSWKDEKLIETTLENLDYEVKKENITKTALILVGAFLNECKNSKLYDEAFSHGYRDKVKF